MRQFDPDLAEMAGTDFIRYDPLDVIIRFGRLGRMPGQAAGSHTDGQRQDQAGRKAQQAFSEQDRGQYRQARDQRKGGRRCAPAQQDTGNQCQHSRRKQP